MAVKVESSHVKFPQLVRASQAVCCGSSSHLSHQAYEAKLYGLYEGRAGIPRMHFFGKVHSKNTMVMQLCGRSLEDLFQRCNRQFSLTTVLKLADEMLLRLKTVHAKGFLHRDIKPDNFLVPISGAEDPSTIFIIDFGLAKRFFDLKSHRHRALKEGKQLTGTARYAYGRRERVTCWSLLTPVVCFFVCFFRSSINTHCGLEQSRRDDLESLGYVLIYFLKGKLPWQGLVNGPNGGELSLLFSSLFSPSFFVLATEPPRTKEDKYNIIFTTKTATEVSVLCEGLPKEFEQYIAYCRSLGYEETPVALRCDGVVCPTCSPCCRTTSRFANFFSTWPKARAMCGAGLMTGPDALAWTWSGRSACCSLTQRMPLWPPRRAAT